MLSFAGLAASFAQPVQDFKFWQERVAQVHVGMRREEVERILPPYDPPEGGSTVRSGFTSEEQGISYAVAPPYTVFVSYDYTGVPRDAQGKILERYSPDNRLLRPVKLRPILFRELRVVMLAELATALASKNVPAITDVSRDIQINMPPRADLEKSIRGVRDAKLSLWLAALQKVDAACDKGFDPKDPNNRAYLTVSPPMSMNGHPQILLPGISPDSIADPMVREEYKRRIADNEEKLKRLNEKMPLYNIRGDWLRVIQSCRQGQYGDGVEDTEMIAQIIATEIKDAALRKEVTELLVAKK